MTVKPPKGRSTLWTSRSVCSTASTAWRCCALTSQMITCAARMNSPQWEFLCIPQTEWSRRLSIGILNIECAVQPPLMSRAKIPEETQSTIFQVLRSFAQTVLYTKVFPVHSEKKAVPARSRRRRWSDRMLSVGPDSSAGDRHRDQPAVQLARSLAVQRLEGLAPALRSPLWIKASRATLQENDRNLGGSDWAGKDHNCSVEDNREILIIEFPHIFREDWGQYCYADLEDCRCTEKKGGKYGENPTTRLGITWHVVYRHMMIPHDLCDAISNRRITRFLPRQETNLWPPSGSQWERFFVPRGKTPLSFLKVDFRPIVENLDTSPIPVFICIFQRDLQLSAKDKYEPPSKN